MMHILPIKDNTITSALYIFIKPLLTLLQAGTPLILYNWFECSAKGPVFTLHSTKPANVNYSSSKYNASDQWHKFKFLAPCKKIIRAPSSLTKWAYPELFIGGA